MNLFQDFVNEDRVAFLPLALSLLVAGADGFSLAGLLLFYILDETLGGMMKLVSIVWIKA